MEDLSTPNIQKTSEATISQNTQIPEENGKKQRHTNNFLFITMIMITALSMFSTGYFAYQTQKLNRELDLLKKQYAVPKNTDAIQNVTNNLVWSNQNLSEPNESFGKDLSSFMAKPPDSMECLNYENGGTLNHVRSTSLSAKINNVNFSKFNTEIENHQFLDNQTGKKSAQTIFYNSICKSNGLYYFLIDTINSETGFINNIRQKLGLKKISVKAAGGMPDTTHFIYSDKNGKLTFMENFPPTTSHLTLPLLKTGNGEVKESSGLTNTGNLAYYGCLQIYATNGSEALVRCGGGDGPGGGAGVFLVNLINQSTKEEVFCLSSMESEKCFDRNGNIYKEVSNPQ